MPPQDRIKPGCRVAVLYTNTPRYLVANELDGDQA